MSIKVKVRLTSLQVYEAIRRYVAQEMGATTGTIECVIEISNGRRWFSLRPATAWYDGFDVTAEIDNPVKKEEGK